MTYVAGNATHLRGRVLSGEPRSGDVYRYDGSAFVCDDIVSQCAEEIVRNRRNIQLLFLQQATYEHMARGNAVDGFYDSFEDQSGVDTSRLTGTHDAERACYVTVAGPGEYKSPYFTTSMFQRHDVKATIVCWRQDSGASGHFEATPGTFNENQTTTSEAGGTKTGFPATAHGLVVGDVVRFEGFTTPAFNAVFTVQPETTIDKIVIAIAYASETISTSCNRYKVLKLGTGGDCPGVITGLRVSFPARQDVSIIAIDADTHGAGVGKVTLSAPMSSGTIHGIHDTAVYNGQLMPAFKTQDSFSVTKPSTPGTRPASRQLCCEIVHCATRKYYVISGQEWATGLYVNDCWEYDIDSDTWRHVTLAGETNMYSRHHSVAFIPSVGKYLIMGMDLDQNGSPRTGSPGRIGMGWFEPTALSWTWITPQTYPTIISRSSGDYDPVNHCFWLFGGDTTAGGGNANSSELWCYNISANTWTQKGLSGTLPSIRARMDMIYEPSHGLLMYGGVDAAGTYMSDIWRYDIATDTWTQLSPSGTAPALSNDKHCFEPANGRWYHWGGMTIGSAFNPYIYYYSISNNSWSQANYTGDLVYGTHASRAQISILDGKMYNFGGNMPVTDDDVRIVKLYDAEAAVGACASVVNSSGAIPLGDTFKLNAMSIKDHVPPGGHIFYALSWDLGETWHVYYNSAWRAIVRHIDGAWQWAGELGWQVAGVNDLWSALVEAVGFLNNQMASGGLLGVPDAGWETAGVWYMPSDSLRIGVVLVSDGVSQPAVSGWAFNRFGGLDIRGIPVPLQHGTSRVSASFLIRGNAETFRHYFGADAPNPAWVEFDGMTKAATMGGSVEYWASALTDTPEGIASMVLRVRAADSADVHGWAATWNG